MDYYPPIRRYYKYHNKDDHLSREEKIYKKMEAGFFNTHFRALIRLHAHQGHLNYLFGMEDGLYESLNHGLRGDHHDGRFSQSEWFGFDKFLNTLEGTHFCPYCRWWPSFASE